MQSYDMTKRSQKTFDTYYYEIRRGCVFNCDRTNALYLIKFGNEPHSLIFTKTTNKIISSFN